MTLDHYEDNGDELVALKARIRDLEDSNEKLKRRLTKDSPT